MKNHTDPIRNRTYDLPSCKAVPQPTMPRHPYFKANMVTKLPVDAGFVRDKPAAKTLPKKSNINKLPCMQSKHNTKQKCQIQLITQLKVKNMKICFV